jgi:hypothetical protein
VGISDRGGGGVSGGSNRGGGVSGVSGISGGSDRGSGVSGGSNRGSGGVSGGSNGSGSHADGGGLSVGLSLEDGLVDVGGGADGSDDRLLESILRISFLHNMYR